MKHFWQFATLRQFHMKIIRWEFLSMENLRAADLDNPYGRYYGKARSWEDILKNKNND